VCVIEAFDYRCLGCLLLSECADVRWEKEVAGGFLYCVQESRGLLVASYLGNCFILIFSPEVSYSTMDRKSVYNPGPRI
jgi:hypothetical protein